MVRGFIKFKTVIIIIIFLFTLVSQVFSVNSSNSVDTYQMSDVLKTKSTKLSLLELEKSPILGSYNINQNDLPLSGEVTIIPKDSLPIQRYPQIISNGKDVFVIAETNTEHGKPMKITATMSLDNGSSWMDRTTISHNITNFRCPAVDYTGDDEMQVYGSHLIDVNTGIQILYCFPSISNPSAPYFGSSLDFSRFGWFNGKVLTWDTTYWENVTGTATAGYKHGTHIGPYEDFHGLTVWGGHDGTGWSYYFLLETDEYSEEPYKLLWKNYLNGTVMDVDIDIDLVTGWGYDLCEIINETTNYPEILLSMLWIEPGNPTWYTNDQNYGPMWTFKNYTNPAIKASDGYVYLACEKNGDIYCHISSYKGYTYSTVKIANTTEFETEPDVTAIGEKVTITYVKNYNLYRVTSNNAGVTWSKPVQVNDQNYTVSMNPNDAAIDNNYVIWSTIETNSTLFFESFNTSTPIIEISNISGGRKISADVKNIGTGDAEGITYSILIQNGFLLSPRKTTGKIDLSVGETKQISTDEMIFGLGMPTVTIQVGTTSKTVKSSLFLFYININN